jgi:hypothetical protein
VELGRRGDLGEEQRRWRPHHVQGGDRRISEEGQLPVLSSHPKFKEPAVLGGLGRGRASVGGVAGQWGGQCDAGLEQRRGSKGLRGGAMR